MHADGYVHELFKVLNVGNKFAVLTVIINLQLLADIAKYN